MYGEHIDNIGHKYGPDSDELRKAIRDIDSVLSDFLDQLVDTGLDEKVGDPRTSFFGVALCLIYQISA